MFDTVIHRVLCFKNDFFFGKFFRKMSKVKSASFFELFSMIMILLEMLRISNFSVLQQVIHFRKQQLQTLQVFVAFLVL